MGGGAWWAAVHGVAKSQARLSDFTFTFHFHALAKEMATHSSILAWRIPGTEEPSGLPSMGSHRVGHDWSDLAAAAAGQSKGHACTADGPWTASGSWRDRRWSSWLTMNWGLGKPFHTKDWEPKSCNTETWVKWKEIRSDRFKHTANLESVHAGGPVYFKFRPWIKGILDHSRPSHLAEAKEKIFGEGEHHCMPENIFVNNVQIWDKA